MSSLTPTAHAHDEHAHEFHDVYEPTSDKVTNGKLALWFFLATEVMFFSGLIGSYIVNRVSDPMAFKPQFQEAVFHGRLNVPLAGLNTVVLIFSSLTMVLAVHSEKTRDLAGVRKWLAATFLCGAGFCVIKAIEYGIKFDHGIGPWTSVFYSFYFGMTGVHASHVIGGMIPLAMFWWKAKDGRFTKPGSTSIECMGLYWHFVDLAWIFLFPLLYLLR